MAVTDRITTDDDDYSFLRPEAGPVPYWKHQRRAKEALKLIIRALKAATNSVKGSKGVGGDLTIDTNRASRIFFVSGEPGSGKSTLYLTLRAMLSSKDEKKYSKGYPPNGDLNKLQGVVRFLDPLDLEVAGDEGENLLAAVLVRLFRVLDDSTTTHSKDCEEAIKDLEELASDIGIAWEGNLQARAGNLDPATFSEEVIRTQRARLRVNERLQEALDKIAKSECYGCGQGTLFVLPVDDFYLKPNASLELLRLLRMISIPRLFFLVMGDITTVEALFIEKSLADWTAVAGTRLFTVQSERLDQALTRARELRARYLRKLLPPGQRATIEAMDWYEALDFEVGSPAGNAAHIETLEKLLEEVKLDSPFPETKPSAVSLLTFLISPPFSEDEQKKRKNQAAEDSKEKDSKEESAIKDVRAAYTALQVLDATPREMMDLGSALHEVIRKQKLRIEDKVIVDDDAPLLLSCVRDFVDLVREEHSFLNERQQEALQGVLPTRHYAPEEINFEMNRLCLQPDPWPWEERNSGQLYVRKHRSWNLTVNSDSINDDKHKSAKSDDNKDVGQAVNKDPFAKLPPRPAAWFVLLHDLAWQWNPDSVTGNLIEKLCKEFNDWKWQLKKSDVASLTEEVGSPSLTERIMEDVKQFLSLFEKLVDQTNKTHKAKQEEEKEKPNPSDDFPGWAIWYDKSGNKYRHFEMPGFVTFRDLDRFLHVWSRGLEWLEKAEVNNIPSLWALAGWTVLTDAYKNFAEEGVEWFKDFEETTGTFEERFEEFKGKLKEKQKGFDYLDQKHDEISKWLQILDKWPEQLRQPKNEVS